MMNWMEEFEFLLELMRQTPNQSSSCGARTFSMSINANQANHRWHLTQRKVKFTRLLQEKAIVRKLSS